MASMKVDISDSPTLNKRKFEDDGTDPTLHFKKKLKDKDINRIIHLDHELDESQDTKINHCEESNQFLFKSALTDDVAHHNSHKKKKRKNKYHDQSEEASLICNGNGYNGETSHCYLKKVKKEKKHKNYDVKVDIDNSLLHKGQDVEVIIYNEDNGTIANKKKKKKKHKKEKHKMQQSLEDSCLSVDYPVDKDLNNTLSDYTNGNIEAACTKKRKKKKKDKMRNDSSSSVEYPTNEVANSIDKLFIKEFKHERIESTSDDSFANSLGGASADTFTLEVHEKKSNHTNSASSSCNSPVESKFDDNKLIEKKRGSKNKENIISEELLTGESIEDLEYLLLLGKEKYNEQLEKRIEALNQLSIMMPWPIPPLHDIETRITGRPSPVQRKEMESLNVKIKTGIFTMAEDEQIKSNWSEFCRLHDLSEDNTSLFLNFTHLPKVNRKQKILFARFLAHGLNNRPLSRVYGRFQKLFRDKEMKQGRFSPKEDQIIIRYMEKCKTKTPFADLEIILKRDRLSIEKRYDNLCSTSEDKGCNWKEPKNIEKFVKRLLRVTRCHNVEELKERKIEPKEWKKMAEKFHIPHHKLRRAWLNTIHPRVFIEDSTTDTNIVKKKIIDKLIENDERDWRAIDWNEIAKDFEGFTGLKLNKLFKSAVKYHVPARIQDNLKDCLEYLKEKNFLKSTLIKIDLGIKREPIKIENT